MVGLKQYPPLFGRICPLVIGPLPFSGSIYPVVTETKIRRRESAFIAISKYPVNTTSYNNQKIRIQRLAQNLYKFIQIALYTASQSMPSIRYIFTIRDCMLVFRVKRR